MSVTKFWRRGDTLDGHPLYTRLKVSAAPATLARRFEMTEEDWQLSGAIMAVSEGTRSEVEAAVRQVLEGGGVVDTALDAPTPASPAAHLPGGRLPGVSVGGRGNSVGSRARRGPGASGGRLDRTREVT